MNRRRAFVLGVFLLVVVGVGGACCTTPLSLRVHRVEVGGVRPAMIPSASWVDPSMVVTFACDKRLIDMAEHNIVVMTAEDVDGNEHLLGVVFCRGIVADEDPEVLRALDVTGGGSMATFLGVFRLDWEMSSDGGVLSDAIRGGGIRSLRFAVRAGGSFVQSAESNPVEVVRGDPRWVQRAK